MRRSPPAARYCASRGSAIRRAVPSPRGQILANAPTPAGQLRRKRILLVDDDPSILSSLSKVLTTAGHEVIVAEDGVAATRRWRERGADLVILDIFMPVMDGLETLALLRAQGPRVPIIVMSGGGATGLSLFLEAKLLGADWTIAKPFTLAEIMTLVSSALREA
jgi:two-component system response regulator AtoC